MTDWKVGDLALCVRGGILEPELHYAGCEYPVTGRAYEVAGMEFDPAEDGMWLDVDGAPDNVSYEGENWGPRWFEVRFVKVTPPEADEFDREVIEQLNGVTV